MLELKELLHEAKTIFKIESGIFYLERFDKNWDETVDVESLDEIENKDKIYLVDDAEIKNPLKKEVLIVGFVAYKKSIVVFKVKVFIMFEIVCPFIVNFWLLH